MTKSNEDCRKNSSKTNIMLTILEKLCHNVVKLRLFQSTPENPLKKSVYSMTNISQSHLPKGLLGIKQQELIPSKFFSLPTDGTGSFLTELDGGGSTSLVLKPPAVGESLKIMQHY